MDVGIRHLRKPRSRHLHYCQRELAFYVGAGTERSSFGNAIFGWAVRFYVSKRNMLVRFTKSRVENPAQSHRSARLAPHGFNPVAETTQFSDHFSGTALCL